MLRDKVEIVSELKVDDKVLSCIAYARKSDVRCLDYTLDFFNDNQEHVFRFDSHIEDLQQILLVPELFENNTLVDEIDPNYSITISEDHSKVIFTNKYNDNSTFEFYVEDVSVLDEFINYCIDLVKSNDQIIDESTPYPVYEVRELLTSAIYNIIDTDNL